jgi:hypothetical protein
MENFIKLLELKKLSPKMLYDMCNQDNSDSIDLEELKKLL